MWWYSGLVTDTIATEMTLTTACLEAMETYLPHDVLSQSCACVRGEGPRPVNWMSVGSTTGRSSSATGTICVCVRGVYLIG